MIEALANMAEAFASADPKTQEFILKMAALAASAGTCVKSFWENDKIFRQNDFDNV